MSFCLSISRGLQALASCVTGPVLFRHCRRQLAGSQTCARGAGAKRRTGLEFWGTQVRAKWLHSPSSYPEAQFCMTSASASHAHSCTGPWDAWTVLRAHFVTCALRVRRNEGRRASSMLYEFAVSSAGRSPVPALQTSPVRRNVPMVGVQPRDEMQQTISSFRGCRRGFRRPAAEGSIAIWPRQVILCR